MAPLLDDDADDLVAMGQHYRALPARQQWATDARPSNRVLRRKIRAMAHLLLTTDRDDARMARATLLLDLPLLRDPGVPGRKGTDHPVPDSSAAAAAERDKDRAFVEFLHLR